MTGLLEIRGRTLPKFICAGVCCVVVPSLFLIVSRFNQRFPSLTAGFSSSQFMFKVAKAHPAHNAVHAEQLSAVMSPAKNVTAERSLKAASVHSAENKVRETQLSSTAAPTEHEARSLTNGTCLISESILKVLDTRRTQHCKTGPFKVLHRDAPKRVAILIRGESYRGFRGVMERNIIVNEATFTCQKRASQSQVQHLVWPLETCGFKVDVFLKTWVARGPRWNGNHSQQLIDFYAGRVVRAVFDSSKMRTHAWYQPQPTGYKELLKMASDYSNKFNTSWHAILIIRFDLIFKIFVVGARYDKWLCPFVAPNGAGDTIQWIPWAFANCAVHQGFQQDACSIGTRIGVDNVGFLASGVHWSDTMADRNPIYKQCRPEQKYEVVGGFNILWFSPRQIPSTSISSSYTAVYKSIRLQGSPVHHLHTDIVLHTWVESERQKQRYINYVTTVAIKDMPRDAIAIDCLGNSSNSSRDATGWDLGLKSMRRVFDHSLRTQNYKTKDGDSLRHVKAHLVLDRIMFVRVDYIIQKSHVSAYACDTDRRICVSFGATVHPTVPTLVIASDKASRRFVAQALTFKRLLEGPTANATEFLMKAFGMPIKIIRS